MTDRTCYIEVIDEDNTIFSNSKVEDLVIYTETSNQAILIGTQQSGDASISIRNNNVAIKGQFDISSSSAFKIPSGTTAQRPDPAQTGQMRYNTTTNTFEGFGAGNTWGSLGGVKDTNQDTYISAESFPTSNDDTLRFFNSNIETMTLTPLGLGLATQQPTERLEISSGNAKFNNNIYVMTNIGIATSNPTESLHVVGNARVSSNIYTTSLGIGRSNLTETLEVAGNAKLNSNLYVLSNLAIGKSNPTSPLDMLGNAVVDGSLTSTKHVLSRGLQIRKRTEYFGYSSMAQSGGTYGFSNDAYGVILSIPQGTSSNYFKFIAACNEIFTFQGDGTLKAYSNVYIGSRLGIGTSNPQASLHVQGGDFLLSGNLGSSNQPCSNIYFNGNIYVGNNVITGANDSVAITTPRISLSNYGTTYFFTSNSFLGLSTTTPQYTLDVNGTFNAPNIYEGATLLSSKYVLSNTAFPILTATSNVAYNASNTLFPLATSTSNVAYTASNKAYTSATQWTTTGSDIYYTTGRIGVGTSNPGYTLDVTGDINFAGNLRQNGGLINLSSKPCFTVSLAADRNRPVYLYPWTTKFNRDNYFTFGSDGRVTVPSAGFYMFHLTVAFTQVQGAYCEVRSDRFNSLNSNLTPNLNVIRFLNYTTNWSQWTQGSVFLSLDANDYVKFYLVDSYAYADATILSGMML